MNTFIPAKIRRVVLTAFIGFLFTTHNLSAQIFNPDKLIADSLIIPLEFANGSPSTSAGITVVDRRDSPPRYLGVRQVHKYILIPVDQYFVMPDSLTELFRRLLSTTPQNSHLQLSIDYLDLWYDSKPFLSPGWMLNAETVLTNNSNDTLSVWQWEFKRKPRRKEPIKKTISSLMQEWMFHQQAVLITKKYYVPKTFRSYRRTLSLWTNTIWFVDGYAIDGRLSLYYPADQQESYLHGVPSLYYRKSSLRESVAIGGNDLQWIHRLSPAFIAKIDGIFRIGFNQFNPKKFGHVDWWNLFLVNFGFAESIEWNPKYHKGLFAGMGLYQSVNALPEVVDRFKPGILFTLGVRLP